MGYFRFPSGPRIQVLRGQKRLENASVAPPILSEEQKQTVTERLNAGISISAIAREFNTTRQTILRVKAGLLQE